MANTHFAEHILALLGGLRGIERAVGPCRVTAIVGDTPGVRLEAAGSPNRDASCVEITHLARGGYAVRMFAPGGGVVRSDEGICEVALLLAIELVSGWRMGACVPASAPMRRLGAPHPSIVAMAF